MGQGRGPPREVGGQALAQRSLARALLHGGLRLLERAGLAVARSRDYYSPLPLVGELAKTRERWDRPSPLTGIEVDLAAQRALLAELVGTHAGELATLPGYEASKGLGYGPGFTEVDALTLYCMVRHLKPRRWLEIGSGLSTYWAWQAAANNAAEGRPCELAAIDPWATAKVATIPGLTVHREPVQATELALFDRLEAGDVLFIDSTHVVKIDGDVPFLYLEVVPRVAPGVVVHAHDVHFPYNVPHPAEQYLFRAQWPMFWTEAMLLQAFLSHNPHYRIELSTPMLRHHDPAFLAATLPGYRPTRAGDYDTHHGSLWFRRVS